MASTFFRLGDPQRFSKSVSLRIPWVNSFRVRTLLVYRDRFIGALVSFPISCPLIPKSRVT